MSQIADFDVKERVREANDIVDVIGSYLELRRQGSNYVALCPWHDDSRPSLQINPSRKTWKCWVCNIGGDVFSFIKQRESVDFREALAILAERAGIQLRQFGGTKAEPGSANDKSTLYAAMEWAQRQFQDCLRQDPLSADARRYVSARQMNEQCLSEFRIGYAPDSWNWLKDRARNTPYSEAVLEACGLMTKAQSSGKLYCPFRGRVIFPIHDTQNRVIAFGGRILPNIAEKNESENRPAPKYYNSVETRLFKKSETLYGLNLFSQAISKQRHMVIVEGYTDVIAAWQAGLDNVVAVLGTALNERHLRLIKRFADRITLVLDGDQAGVKRADEILDLFVAAESDLRILTLPDEMDPCDYLQQKGAASFRTLLEESPDALDYKIKKETFGIDLINDTHQSNRALENILAVLARAPGKSSAGQVRREQLLTKLSHQFGIDVTQIRNRLNFLAGKRSATAPTQLREPAPQPQLKLVAKEKELLQILCQDPENLDTIVENISPGQFVQGPARELYELFCECYHQGHDHDFQSVLTMLENSTLKLLLVDLDEEESRKRDVMEFNPQKRLADILLAFEMAEIEDSKKETDARLNSPELDDQEETDLLMEKLEIERRRQGL